MYFRMNILILFLIGLIGFYACENSPLNYNSSWQKFIQSGEEFSPGNYPFLVLLSRKHCKGLRNYIVINSYLQVLIDEPGGTSLGNRYLVQIKTKSGDYEEAVASSTGVEDLHVHFATPEIKI